MNTHFYGFDIQSSNQICPIHQTVMLKLGGHINCKQCSIDSVAQSQKEHAHAVNTMVRKKHFEGAQIPSRHADSGFGNYMVQNNGQQHAKAQCASFVKDFNSGVKRNLIMVGRTGTGKTHLACTSAIHPVHYIESWRLLSFAWDVHHLMQCFMQVSFI